MANLLNENVVIDVTFDASKTTTELERVTKELIELQKQQSDLKQAFKDGSVSAEEFAIKSKELGGEIAKTAKQQQALIAASKQAKKSTDEYGDSLDEERRKLSDMSKAYANLSRAERESAKGLEFRNKIKQQSELVKDLEKNIGQTQRNVGNYAEAIREAMGKAGNGVTGFTEKVKMLVANPIILFLTAIVTIVKKVADAFGHSEERTEALNKALAPIRGVLDALGKAFETLANVITEYVVKAIEGLTAGFTWLINKIAPFVEKVFGVNIANAIATSTDNMNKLTKAEQDYIKHKRAWVEEEAKLENDLAQLHAKVEEKDKYTAEERLKMLEQANKIELQLASGRRQLLKENLQLLELEAERGDNDAEANDRLAEARAAVVRADTEYFAKQKELNAKLAALRAEMLAVAKAKAAEWAKLLADMEADEVKRIEAMMKEEEAAAARELNIINEQREAAENFLKERNMLREKYGVITYQEQMDAEMAVLLDAYENNLLSTEEYELARTGIVAKYAEKRMELGSAEAEAIQTKFEQANKAMIQNYSQAMSGLGELFGEFAETSEGAANAQRAFAMSSILINQAIAISEGAKSIAAASAGAAAAAAAGGPAAPALLAAYQAQMVGSVLAVVASVASTIVQAKQILDQANSASDAGKFAVGGIVGGTSYTGDRLTAHVNSRESIMTLSQQKRLFDIANGAPSVGFDMGAFAQVITNAVANQPAPIMVYSEYNDFKNRVATYNEYSKI